MKVAVIGGGAAGFFAALNVAEHYPEATVVLYEKSDKVLSKVRISGGGRCNVTHDEREPRKLAKHYPRGGAFLRKAFKHFAVSDTIAWFEAHGVLLKVEGDGRMFPTTDDSETIAQALLRTAIDRGIRVELRSPVSAIQPVDGGYLLSIHGKDVRADRVIITAGGHPKPEAYRWLADLGHRIESPVPSLFTFNIPGDPIRELMGVVLQGRVRIAGEDLESTGPVLITHWGLSGPAVLRLSAWGARILHAKGYGFTVQVNWLQGRSEDDLRATFAAEADQLDRKMAANADPFQLPKRFWEFQLRKAGIDPERVWGTVAKKERNRLIDLLTNDRFEVQGKTTFKEEFVTAGGVALSEVDPDTMQSMRCPGLYFAGEVLDIDGITGGFNFQAAWTTGYIAGQLRS
ncbi:MAG: NAD(P)/FAD-dependent oxidoreductase [Flavobacteriales bacterium]|nr:NAD(P)/FAD-dependent oxidoreductase [Flavobacteriales bacterium]